MSSSPPFDIAAVGLGIVGVHHLTREAEGLVRASTEVFSVSASRGVESYLQTLGPPVTDLRQLYEIGHARIHTYQSMAAHVVAAAVHNPPITFATYGHPYVFCYPTVLIQRAARLLDLRFEAAAGVSALDMLLLDVGYDPSTHGLQSYDATDLLLRRRPLQDDVACVLWQVTSLADATYRPQRRSAEEYQPLQDYLLQFYPPDHTIVSVYSRTHPAMRSIIRKLELDVLAQQLAEPPHSGTLFIPPVRPRPIVDEDLSERILAQHTQA